MSLFIELRKHGKLAAKRNPMYEKNKFGKFWMYFMAVFWAGYLIFFGTTFAFAFGDGATEAYHVLNSGLIFVLFLDFLMRFPFQKTPAQEVKPYLLLPVKRNRLIDFLLTRSGLNGFNLIWLFFFVPFAIISITKFYGITGVLTYSIGIWLLMILNNYWFLLCRTLMNERVWWIILPILVYGIIAAGMFIPDDSPLFDWSIDLGEGFILGHFLTFIGTFAAIVALWLINRGLMIKLIYNEINKVEDTKSQTCIRIQIPGPLRRNRRIHAIGTENVTAQQSLQDSSAHGIPGSRRFHLYPEFYRSIRWPGNEKLYHGLQLCDFRYSVFIEPDELRRQLHRWPDEP